MRVLQAMAGAKVGGAEAFFMRLVPALAQAAIPQAAVIRRHPERARILRDAGIPVAELNFGGPLDLLGRWSYGRAIRHARPDIVMTWMNRASGQCPRGSHVQIGRLGGFYDLKHYRNCAHLVGNTQGIVDYLVAQGWPAARAHLIGNFADTALAVPVERAGLDTPEGVPLLLALGRLHPNKAFDVLIEALVDVPEAHLWLAGEGPLRDLLHQHARDRGVAGRIRFLGWRDDVGALLAAADVLVCPSRHEPLGNVVLEAWARGVPVVAAASQGPSELIVEAQNGLLVPVEDARALARAIRAVIDDPALARALAQGGSETYEAGHSRNAVVAAYRDLFEKALS
jgi:glycosyltransferase involved in cell wall biosynthesis